MLRKKINPKKTNEEKESESITLKAKIGSDKNEERQQESQRTEKDLNDSTKSIKDISELSSWLVENIFSNDVIQNMQDYLPIAVPNTDSQTEASKWVEMLIKSNLHKEDIDLIVSNSEYKFDENLTYKKKYETLLETNYELSSSNEEKTQEMKKIKSQMNKMKNELNKKIDLKDFVQESLDEFKNAHKLREILDEAVEIEGSQQDGNDFLLAFVISVRDILVSLESSKEEKEDALIKQCEFFGEKLFEKITEKYHPQRKALLDKLASVMTTYFQEYEVVSPEQYTFIDTSVHNVPDGGGQKIVEGQSFAILNKNTKQTITYADVIAQ